MPPLALADLAGISNSFSVDGKPKLCMAFGNAWSHSESWHLSGDKDLSLDTRLISSVRVRSASHYEQGMTIEIPL